MLTTSGNEKAFWQGSRLSLFLRLQKIFMKKYLVLFTFSVVCFQLFAQTKKKPQSHAAAHTATVKLMNQTDSLSYSIGILVLHFINNRELRILMKHWLIKPLPIK